MQDNSTPVTKEFQAEFKESNFGIKSKADMVHIFNVMRNKIYSNKPLAVVREYSTNAMDAHIEADKRTLPIQVNLPHSGNLFFTVRDFGTGLSEEGIRETYTQYGASSKRGSTELNGQLGLGSKAAFAYGDTFRITSFHDGVKSEYEAFIDETKLGAITHIRSTQSTEPSGMEIKVPVRPNDVTNFQTVAIEFYRYFSPRPNFIGNTRFNIPVLETLEEGTSWKFMRPWDYRGGTVGIMGNVCYPLDMNVLSQAIGKTPDWETYRQILTSPFQFTFKVGDLNIAASREALEYDSKTISSIVNAMNDFKSDWKRRLQVKINECKDIVAARHLFGRLEAADRSVLLRIATIKDPLTFQGEILNSANFELPDTEVTYTKTIKEEVKSFTKSAYAATYYMRPTTLGVASRTQVKTSGQTITIRPDKNTKGISVFVNDTDQIAARIQNAFALDADLTGILCIRPHHKSTIANFKSHFDLPEDHYTNLSTIAPAKDVKEVKSVSNKNYKKYFAYKLNSLKRYENAANWEILEKEELEKQDKLYVEIDQYRPLMRNGRPASEPFSMHTFASVLDTFKLATGIDLSSRIIGIKKSGLEKKPATWISLNTFMRDHLITLVPKVEADEVKKRDLGIAFFGSANFIVANIEKFTTQELEELNIPGLQELKTARTNRYQNDVNIDNIKRMFQYYQIVYKTPLAVNENKFHKMSTDLSKKCPLLDLVTAQSNMFASNGVHVNSATHRRYIIDYVKGQFKI